MRPHLSDKGTLAVLGTLGAFGCAAGAITACNAVAADGGIVRMIAGIVLLVIGLASFIARRRVGM